MSNGGDALISDIINSWFFQHVFSGTSRCAGIMCVDAKCA